MRTHLFPFRTQKLSSHTPTILGWQRPGKIGSRRDPKELRSHDRSSFSLSPKARVHLFISLSTEIRLIPEEDKEKTITITNTNTMTRTVFFLSLFCACRREREGTTLSQQWVFPFYISFLCLHIMTTPESNGPCHSPSHISATGAAIITWHLLHVQKAGSLLQSCAPLPSQIKSRRSFEVLRDPPATCSMSSSVSI